ncbi:MAG: hypothetical protein J6Z11_02885 [Candidatus Riflebacteria bacterium]|nr:hypothetical protein [Candidatus Riflebacteria bacterium]
MKVRRYDELLRSRGYKCIQHQDYCGEDVYIKKHSKNVIKCFVQKDSHGKAQTMTFKFLTHQFENMNPDELTFEYFKEQEFDREYLWREANKIHECFEQLKQMKSPKHIYF